MGGFIALGIHEGEDRIGYDLENIENGESHILIRKSPAEGWYRHGKYYFNPDGLSFGRSVLNNINPQTTGLVIIDEIGPMELKGKGWAKEIEKLVTKKDIMQLWVVRRHLLKRVFRQWRIGDVLIIDVGEETVERAADECIEFMDSHHKDSIL